MARAVPGGGAMRKLFFLAFVLAPLSTLGCQDAANDLTIQDATAIRLADNRIQTTVTVACLGDCSAEASHCVQVTWPANEPDATHDVAEACSKKAPTLDAPATIVVTSQGPIPEGPTDGDQALEQIQLLNGDGSMIPQDISSLGGALTSPEEVVSIP
jgi:hypothetical protein